MSDIKFTPNAVVVEGPCGVNEENPMRDLHVTGNEIHSGGPGSGFSFSDRAADGFVDTPAAGERWVWYAHEGKATLWSGKDMLTVSPKGWVVCGMLQTYDLNVRRILGHSLLGKQDTDVWLSADRLVLAARRYNATTKELEPIAGDDKPLKNVALRHLEGDVLSVNDGNGYSGGVEIHGTVTCLGNLMAGDIDVALELGTLKDQLSVLQSEITTLQAQVSDLQGKP